jgi:hypothetical protein
MPQKLFTFKHNNDRKQLNNFPETSDMFRVSVKLAESNIVLVGKILEATHCTSPEVPALCIKYLLLYQYLKWKSDTLKN